MNSRLWAASYSRFGNGRLVRNTYCHFRSEPFHLVPDIGLGNPGIDRGFTLFVDFGSLTEENYRKSSASAHGCKGLMIK